MKTDFSELTGKMSNYITSLESRMIYRNSKYIQTNKQPGNSLVITSMESNFKDGLTTASKIHRMI